MLRVCVDTAGLLDVTAGDALCRYSRAATSHPMEMLEYNKGPPPCSMCKLMAADPVYKNMVGKVSRARFYCTTCKTCIRCRNPLWWAE